MAAGVAVNAVGRGHPEGAGGDPPPVRRHHAHHRHHQPQAHRAGQEGLRGDAGGPEGQLPHGRLPGRQSDAVETAIKFARAYTGRSQIIAFHGAYHGVWCGTAALTTGYNYRHGWGPLIAGVTHLPYAYCYRCPFGMEYPELRPAVRQVRRLRPQQARTRGPTTSPP